MTINCVIIQALHLQIKNAFLLWKLKKINIKRIETSLFRKMQKGICPEQASSNNLEVEEIPSELSILNSVERHLIS